MDDPAVAVEIAQATGARAQLGQVVVAALGDVAHCCRMQDDPRAKTLQRLARSLVDLDIGTKVTEDQRGRESTKGAADNDDPKVEPRSHGTGV